MSLTEDEATLFVHDLLAGSSRLRANYEEREAVWQKASYILYEVEG